MKDNKYLIPVLLIATAIVTIIGGTFAYWNWQTTNAQKTNVTFTVGSNFSCGADGGGNINGTSLAPTDCTNTTYAIQKTITTSITNNGADPVYMDLWLDIDSIGSGLTNSENFRYVLSTSSTSCTSGIVTKGNFKGKVAGDKIELLKNVTSGSTYYLYIWLDKAETDSSTQNQSVSLSLGGECSNNGVSCPNQVVPMNNSVPNAPVLDDGMIPVTVANDGTVTTVATSDSTWYNYQNQEWANAVLVKESGIKTRAENKVVGTTINKDDILAYYVWIPRYKYAFTEQMPCSCIDNVNKTDYPSCYDLTAEDKSKMIQFIIDEDDAKDEEQALGWYVDGYSDMYIEWYNEENDPDLEKVFMPDNTVNNPRTIDIVFESGTPTKSTGTATGTSYYTHPAFTFGSEEFPGFWAGKFESSVDTASTCYTTPSRSNCDNANQSPRIVPNVDSIRHQTVSNEFVTSLKFAGGTQSGSTVTFVGNSTYGLTSSADSHMMKNSEWGAMAYLSHSNYGKNDEIRINNYYNNGYKTGCGASTDNARQSTTCDIIYGNASSYPQSTTGNISGVFDTSGGVAEYVMGHWSDSLSASEYEDSDFSALPTSKYIDIYSDSVFTNHNVLNITFCTLATCGGHALYETATWYGDDALFVGSYFPWFERGGGFSNDYGLAGAFYFDRNGGGITDHIGWRGVLIAR